MKTIAIIAGMLLSGAILADAILDAAFREAEIQVVSARVAQCGEDYRQRYEAALKRVGSANGYEIHHEPNCEVKVVKI